MLRSTYYSQNYASIIYQGLVTKLDGVARNETKLSSSLPSVSSMTGGMMERRVSQLVCIAGLMFTSISHTYSERHGS